MQYGLIGQQLGHSFSKPIHESLAGYTYELTPLSPEELPAFMTKKDFKAINVTIPYKEKVIPYLDEIDEKAAAIGAVNTIVNRNGRLYGYNTDYLGLRYMLTKLAVEVAGKKVLVLGSGGASKAVIAVCKDRQASEVLTVSRSGRNGALTYEECIKHYADADIIINTTPAGMFPDTDASAIDLTPFSECLVVLDIIYNPYETKLTAQARALGKKAATGLWMLVAQAKYAVEYFINTSIDIHEVDHVYNEIAASLYPRPTLKMKDMILGQGRPKICIPITAVNEEELASALSAISGAGCDMAEWRADFMLAQNNHCISSCMEKIKSSLPELPLLVTIRSKAEGGVLELDDAEYIRFNKEIIDSGLADLIDIEYNRLNPAAAECIAYAKAHKLPVVLSLHDWTRTPDIETLKILSAKMAAAGADIVKIAVTPGVPYDVIQLLAATEEISRLLPCPLITMSMGSLGAVSRLCGEAIGSVITYASLTAASAPGQMDASFVKEALNNLKLKV